MHGNSLGGVGVSKYWAAWSDLIADRGFSYRVSLYKLLTRLGYHILTFDYRCRDLILSLLSHFDHRAYGDSSPASLSERTAVEDGRAVFRWIQEIVRSDDRPRIVLWGHSLGTAIATRTLLDIQEDNEDLVAGLVLESPFNKMEDELKHFKTVTWTAWILGTVISCHAMPCQWFSILFQDIAEALRITQTEFLTELYLQVKTSLFLALWGELWL